MSHSGATLEPRLHAELTSVIVALFEARQTAVSAFAPDRPAVSPDFQRTIEELSIYYYKSWRVPDLCANRRHERATVISLFPAWDPIDAHELAEA